MHFFLRLITTFTLTLILVNVHAHPTSNSDIRATDDLGNVVKLDRPAKRIISLAPHVTEFLFAIGAGDKIIGTVKYSDYPAAANTIPRIGDNRLLDIERIIALKPDLIVVWMHGAFERQLEPLAKSGIPYFFSEPHTMEDIPTTMIKLGNLLGHEKQAKIAADNFNQQLKALTENAKGKRTVRTFYQVWSKPLYTLNNSHIVSDALRLCGGENIFGKLAQTSPTITFESVVLENPEVIITGTAKNKAASGIDIWKPVPMMHAVKNGNLFEIDGDLLHRSGPRIIEGAKQICAALEQVRNK